MSDLFGNPLLDIDTPVITPFGSGVIESKATDMKQPASKQVTFRVKLDKNHKTYTFVESQLIIKP